MKIKKKIKPGDDFNSVSLEVNGTRVNIAANGDATIRISGGTLTISKDGRMNLQPVANDDERVTLASEQSTGPAATKASVNDRAHNVGDVLPDGWIVGPISPDTGNPIAIEPVAGALEGYQTWYAGEEHAQKLRIRVRKNARQPSAGELNAIYNEVVKAGCNQNAKFDTSNSFPVGKYWSSTPYSPHPFNLKDVRIHYFDKGNQSWHFSVNAEARVRCVRDEPNLKLA